MTLTPLIAGMTLTPLINDQHHFILYSLLLYYFIAVVLWNTIYMQAALDHTRQTMQIKEEDEVRLYSQDFTLGLRALECAWHYSFTVAEQVMKGHLRPLNQSSINQDESLA